MLPVKEIIAAHPGLVQKLRRFSLLEAARLAASLSLLPDLHAQTMRIEMLQHLVASCAEGKRTPERDDLAEWVGKYLTSSPFGRHEDPVEDVFIGSVNSPFGSFRLLMGEVADADFWIERLLVFLAEKEEFPPFQAALAQVIPLLKLGDRLVDRLGFERYRAGGGIPAAKIPVPRWRDLQPPFNALVFSSAELAEMGVARPNFDAFVFKEEHRKVLLGEHMWHSILERRPLSEAAKDFAGHDTLTEVEQAALHAHLRSCAAEFEKLPGFSSGMVLISAAGLRRNLLGISQWDSHWHVHGCSLPDWLRLAAGGQCTAMRLWKLSEHAAVLRRNGTELLNTGGLPNLFAAWKRNGFRILPRDRHARGLPMFTLGFDFATELRIEVRRREDAHCLLSNDGKRWSRLVRYNAAPLFQDDERIHMYADSDVVKERRLTGCIEESSCVWWVVFSGEDVPEQRSTVFQLWECIFSWAARLAKVALEKSSPLRGVTNMEVEIQLPNLSNWQSDERSRNVPTAGLSASADVTRSA